MEINLDYCYASIRYLPTVGSYVVRGYLVSLSKIADMKVDEVELLKFLSDSPTDLDDDTSKDLRFIADNYFLTEVTLMNAKKQYHRKRLNRVLTSVLYLNRRKHVNKRVYEKTQNIEEYERIYRNCIAKDKYEDFMRLNKEWCRYNHIRFDKRYWKKKYIEERVDLCT